jgi:hypothetical protein
VSTEAISEFVKEFPRLYDMRTADKNNKKEDKI